MKRIWVWFGFWTFFVVVGVVGTAKADLSKLYLCEDLGFSTEEDFVTQGPVPPDGNPIISDGDLLGPGCIICARNADLLAPFDIPNSLDLGLDAADVLVVKDAKGQVTLQVLAFSTELDSSNAGQFSAGDLLIVGTHTAIIPNVALLKQVYGQGSPPMDFGLDAVHFVGSMESIVNFLQAVDSKSRQDFVNDPTLLAQMLNREAIDIWFSTEGTGDTPSSPRFLDGDLISAATGAIVLSNADLLPASVPSGIPNRGVDFGLDGVTAKRSLEPTDLHFTTEILYSGVPRFTDGDVLKAGDGVVVATQNKYLITCFEPKALFLGLDAISAADPAAVFIPRRNVPLDLLLEKKEK